MTKNKIKCLTTMQISHHHACLKVCSTMQAKIVLELVPRSTLSRGVCCAFVFQVAGHNQAVHPTISLSRALTINGNEEGDIERKKKKEEKAKEKEAKKLKAAQKAEAAKAVQALKASQPVKGSKMRESRRPVLGDEDEADFFDPPTPAGEKKRLAPNMAKAYSPKAVEAGWYEWWEKEGFFVADPLSKKPPFVIVVPPPNVTGALHIGHGLTCAIEDTIVRWQRMRGFNALWVPGVDHAGISTQVVVEKKIMKAKGLTRHDLGREKFVAEVWGWKEEYGGRICKQLRRMGASLDWSRECFTMDAKRSKAVVEAFVRLHSEGLIYRDNRLVNWDTILRTAISDIEVVYLDIKGRTLLKVPGYDNLVEFGTLTSFAYPLDGGGEIVVATTRPETMLGDSAVAVHPGDDRYKHLHGRHVVHPFNKRRIPIICDSVLVDPTFGTGAVKITPAHDPNDFAVGKRHGLDFINIFTDDGKIHSNGGQQFEGMPRFHARTAVIEALKAEGLFRNSENNDMRLGICSRTEDIIEPMIKPQWFVYCGDMAKEACNAARDGRLEIIPKQSEAEWFRWLENIQDWCISRQLWWGHRIPAWYVTLEEDELQERGAYDDHWVVGRNQQEAEAKASHKFHGKKYKLTQDPDVLDTWFSSGLFPFSVMGWPEETLDLKAFYPTSLLETGHDILFFWVARMVMLGMRLTGEVPFKKVFLHAMVRDAHGRKMSKSLGNVIDPLEVIEGISLNDLLERLLLGNLDKRELETARSGMIKDFPKGIAECGADALRFALVAYTAQSDKINLDIQRVEGYRLWCNKLWNAIRFGMINLEKDCSPSKAFRLEALPLSCRWILSVLNKAIEKTNACLEAYDLSGASTALYSWWRYELCDVFIELCKPVFGGHDAENEATTLKKATKETLWVCLETGLRLLHPFMPFLTEELWQRLPHGEAVGLSKSSIMVAEYPRAIHEWTDLAAEAQICMAQTIWKVFRSLRENYLLEPKERPEGFILCRVAETDATVRSCSAEIQTLASLSKLHVVQEGWEQPSGCAVSIVSDQLSVYLLMEGIIDVEKQISILAKDREDIMQKLDTLSKKFDIPGYREKVPLKVQEENTAKLNQLRGQLQNNEEVRIRLENFRFH